MKHRMLTTVHPAVEYRVRHAHSCVDFFPIPDEDTPRRPAGLYLDTEDLGRASQEAKTIQRNEPSKPCETLGSHQGLCLALGSRTELPQLHYYPALISFLGTIPSSTKRRPWEGKSLGTRISMG